MHGAVSKVGVILYIFGMCNSSCLKISMELHVTGVGQKHVLPILYTQSYLVSLWYWVPIYTCVFMDTTPSKEYRTESILVKLSDSPGLDNPLNSLFIHRKKLALVALVRIPILYVWANWILQTSEAISSGNIERILMIFFLPNRIRRALSGKRLGWYSGYEIWERR